MTSRRKFVTSMIGTVGAASFSSTSLGQFDRAKASLALELGGIDLGSPASFFDGRTNTPASYIEAAGVRFEYFDLGNPGGQPLVLIHGFPDSAHAWEGVVKHLDLSRYRILIPALRGFGGTRVLNPEILGGQQAALGNDLLEWLTVLGVRTFHLVGHDWGAKAAYAAAIYAPERVLSLSTLATAYLFWNGKPYPPAQVHCNWYQFYFQVEPAVEALRDNAASFCHELWTTWSPEWHFSEQDFQATAVAWKNPQFMPIVLNYYRMRWGGATGLPTYAEKQALLDAKPKPSIKVPTLFIQGSADACDLPEGADGQEVCFDAGYERVVLQGAGHFPHREQAAAVAEKLKAHVSAHTRSVERVNQ